MQFNRAELLETWLSAIPAAITTSAGWQLLRVGLWRVPLTLLSVHMWSCDDPPEHLMPGAL